MFGYNNLGFGADGIVEHDADLTLLYQFDQTKSLVAVDSLGPTLGITRATDATYFDSAGVMQTASSGVARFNHLPISPFTSLGLLVEEERTNICLYSEDLTHATWTETNTDQPTTNNAAPDGATTADEIAATSTADQAFAIYQAFTGRTAGQSTSISVFLKSGTNATKAQLTFDSDGSGADGVFCNFDLSAGTAGTVTALAAGTATSSSITDIGDGWYRCNIVGKIAAGTVARLTISISDNISGAVFEAANLTDNDSIICWGSEINVNVTFETSYIPTVAASVTRNQDDVRSVDVSWLDTASTLVGTIYFEASVPQLQAQVAMLGQFDDGATIQRIEFGFMGSDNKPRLKTFSSGGGNGNIFTSAVTPDTTFRVAAAYADDDLALSHDGAAVVTDATANFPLGAPTALLLVGRGFVSNQQLNGHLRELRYYNVRKANTFLVDLSSGARPE